MELRLLRYFIALANYQNISEAAKQLHISQPTLSRQLSDLEKELDTPLFLRGNRKISLTDEGLFFLTKAKEIVDLADKMMANFNSSAEMISGKIYIGSGESEAMAFIAKTVKKISEKHPEIQFHLHSGNSEAILEKLDAGLLDFGIVIDPVDKKNYDYISLPITDTWGVLMHKDSPLADQSVIVPENLIELPLILSQQSIIYNGLSGWFGENVNNLKIRCTYNLLYNAAKMVEAKVGYALCLDKLIASYDDSHLRFRPLHPPLTANLYLIWKKYPTFSKAAAMFLNQLKTDIEAFIPE